MDCSWIKIYDTPEGGEPLNPDTLYAGDVIYVDINELPQDYIFNKWTDLQGNILSDDVIIKMESGRYKTTVSCGGSFVANIRKKQEEICLVVVKCDTSKGSVTRGDGYDICGESVTISATPGCCYEFEKWNDNNTDNPRVVDVTDGTSIYTAIFKEKQFNITVSANDDGLGSVSITSDTVKCGESFTIIAEPNINCRFDLWKDEDGNVYEGSEATLVYDCEKPTSFRAYFSKIECNITFETNGEAELKINDKLVRWGTTVDIGNETPTFDVTTQKGCCFVGWFDKYTGLYLNPCVDREITGYKYIIIQKEYIQYIDIVNIKTLTNNEFIKELEEKTLAKENLIIYNKETGEYRQAIPICDEEAYDFPCDTTLVAVIMCDFFNETVGNDGQEYTRYEGNFGSFYDFLQNYREETYTQYIVVNIKGVDRYLEHIRCNEEERENNE